MPKFIFRLPSEDNIKNSSNGGIMLHIIRTDYDEKFTVVTGCPGSGKTTVSIFRLIRLIENGKATILLTFQRMLKVAIENLLASRDISNPSSRVSTLHSWFPKNTNGKFLDVFGDDSKKLNSEEIIKLLENKGLDKFELILDEAQDLENRIFESFPKIFGRITLGADDDQQMKNGIGVNEYAIKKYLDSSLNEFDLQFNYRNTFQIYDFARRFVPESKKANDSKTLEHLKRYKNNGDLPQLLKFNSQNDMRVRLKKIIDDNISGFNIGILFLYKEQVKDYYKVLQEMANGDCSMYYAEMTNQEKTIVENDLKSILITTFISAKGMEFDLVIMPEFQSVKNTPEDKKKYYVGCTRAKSRLYILHTGDTPTVLSNFPKETFDSGNLF